LLPGDTEVFRRVSNFVAYLLIGVAGVVIAILVNWLTAAFSPKGWTLRRFIVGIAAGVLVVAVLTVYTNRDAASASAGPASSDGLIAAGPTPTTSPPTTPPSERTPTATPSATTTTTSAARGADGGGGSDEPLPEAAENEKYLSELPVADYNHDSGTGQWSRGTKTIAGRQFGHSVSMNAGCQNDDGGDYWIDYSLDGSWTQLTATLGITDRSSTESSGTYAILDAVTGRRVAEGRFSAGPGVPIRADVTGIVRLRLYMNDPNSPNQYCGFERIDTAVVWGDAQLTK
jgi:hypothetical protein